MGIGINHLIVRKVGSIFYQASDSIGTFMFYDCFGECDCVCLYGPWSTSFIDCH